MISCIQHYCNTLLPEFQTIPQERKEILCQIAQYMQERLRTGKVINLVYICTHNSRRSHFGQIWAQVAAHYYNIPNVYSFSGGTEVTAFNSNAIHALKRIGFVIKANGAEQNTRYSVFYAEDERPCVCFSKTYHDPENPQKEFAAIMTCGEAEENCPFIPGAEFRISTTYEDPKAFDYSPLQDTMYDRRCRQIALETFFTFSKLT